MPNRRSHFAWKSVCRGITAVLLLTVTAGCGGKPPDPVAEIRSLVPQISRALNARDIGGLKKLGTRNFLANQIIIETFPDGKSGEIAVGFVRVRLMGDNAELFAEITRPGTADVPPRPVVFAMVKNSHWHIDGFRFPEPEPAADTTAGADSLGN